MKNLRKELPLLSTTNYLNTASSGLLYDSLLNFRQNHDQMFLNNGSIFRENQQFFLNSVRKTVAEFFDNSKGDTALTPNFSLGLNTILNGLQKNEKILLLNDDYPSINFAVNNKGFEVCYAKIDDELEHNIEKSIKKHKPTVFIFSLIQYINGITIDLDFLKEIKLKYPELLIIADATQFCGTKIFNFSTSGIDILGCSGYKWLLGGYGNGFILFKEGLLKKITPSHYVVASQNSNYDKSYTNLMARFECGHLDTFNFGSLKHSLEILSDIGLSNIEMKINELASSAKNQLNELNLLEEKVVKRKSHSSIFNIKGDSFLFEKLTKQNIITSLRGSGIRISLHFYNTKGDIEELIHALHRYR
ncbi:aminotransferase class V-fold PLP-dependent enzyme [Aquimarina gracilis]|uniref:Aminotransferase class V-fold PLP-dependent enzyme n=1 Tax=Aquimarina gracilis TaxID=874422 RepID=A0ABU5ZPG2_9FLAO|nr:aminotransferase class V-fold PLP-dependent enzyme [Aquimarina gracilis]MEB3344009.1 aminotransferase class V-fold PLP-dependent enzyme [Aquimarina gracilis]